MANCVSAIHSFIHSFLHLCRPVLASRQGSSHYGSASLDLRGINVVCLQSGDELKKEKQVAVNVAKSTTVGELQAA